MASILTLATWISDGLFPQFFELHGRYGPEGPLQLYVQGWY